MNPRFYTRDAIQEAFSFLVSQITYIEPQVVAIQYPEVQYANLIPVDTSAPEWTKSVTYFSMDKVGRAEWFQHGAKDIPLADVVRQKHETTVEMAGIGYSYDLEEIGQAMQAGINLTPDKAAAARRAYEEFVDNYAFRGDDAKGAKGLINSDNVTTVLAEANGNGGSTAWLDKSADHIIDDINNALTGIYTESLTVEMADTILLPVRAATILGTKRIPDTQMDILSWISMKNVFTQITGQPLTIRAVRGLETAGAGGTGRMIAYRRDPAVLKMHIPMTHRFFPVWQTGPITFDVPGIFRLGGVEIKRNKAVRYVDGILEAAYE